MEGLFQSTRPRGARRCLARSNDWCEQFQSTRPRGARPRRRVQVPNALLVSIHAPARGATLILEMVFATPLCFNPRARAGRDIVLADDVSTLFQFQSTRPRGARQKDLIKKCMSDMFQSTRPRGARLVSRSYSRAVYHVSIHAPARGATFSVGFPCRCLIGVSIHAPARGATWGSSKYALSHASVSIHAPARGATRGGPSVVPRHPVSIHAPARGATYRRYLHRCSRRGFNPRARAGRDSDADVRSFFRPKFQSTRPRGARRGA